MPIIYEVGGAVRDRLLGFISKDRDFVFVLRESELENIELDILKRDRLGEEAYKFMRSWMSGKGYRIFQESPANYTIRARFPESSLVADFVLARKELGYIPGTRQPLVAPGSLEDDLRRRDFTINAMAEKDGELVDLFGGLGDLHNRILRTPLDPMMTLKDDPLRALRAVRFAVKLGFVFDADLFEALHQPELVDLMGVVSDDRIREELTKTFQANTWQAWRLLSNLPPLLVRDWLTRPNMWLMPTTKQA